MKLLNKIFGDTNTRYLKTLAPTVENINKLEPEIKKLDNDGLKHKTEEFRERLRKKESFDDFLPEAFAMVREASRRTTGMRHFDVQLLGGIVLHRGEIAEMRTGEGKTLVATLPLYLNALAGKGAHLVTVNDYLARRDAVWMGQVYHALGLTVGCVQHDQAFLFDPGYKPDDHNDQEKENEDSEEIKAPVVSVDMDFLRPVSRREAYQADITYGTNNEFGFDYLRDNMVVELDQKVQRPLYYAIVDEVDSILVDEARTPLIISAPSEESADMYYTFARIVQTLKENEDYNVDEKLRAATLTEAGIEKVEKTLGVKNLYTEGGIKMVHHLEQALKARTLFHKDKDYVVKEGEVIIVDEFTGRLMEGRRYSEGLHQAIEAKEGVDIQKESQTLATITFQNYFRMYKKLSGMTGTAATEAEEFAKIYGLDVTIIPTHRPMIRNDMPDSVYKTEQGKLKALIRNVKERNKKGQPILIGTISIEKNELVSQLLSQAGVSHELLNAKNHAKEAEIIAQAGRVGAVTVATNMAGRGVDIILGGKPFEKEQYEKVKSLGGLHVLGTERHESRRIDNQLRGRAGRQGDPGSSQFFVSMEDDLMRVFGSDRMKNMMTRLGVPDDMPIENKMISRSIEQAQKKIEGHHFDIRKRLVEFDDVINKHREVIYKKRNEILEMFEKDQKYPKKDSRLKSMLMELIEQEIEQVVSFHTAAQEEGDWDIKEIYETVKTIFPLDRGEEEKIKQFGKKHGKSDDVRLRTELIEYLVALARDKYARLEQEIKDGAVGEDPYAMRRLEKSVYLRSIDMLWIEHLEAMDYLRHGIGLRGYGQRDPLVEYKKEAYRMFNTLMNGIQNQVVYSIYKLAYAHKMALKSPLERAGVVMSAPAKTMERGSSSMAGPSEGGAVSSSAPSPTGRFDGKKVGRNDPCPCGATKPDGTPVKYKKCHGK